MATTGRRESKPERRMEGSCRVEGRGEEEKERGKKRKKNRQSRESLALANALITR